MMATKKLTRGGIFVPLVTWQGTPEVSVRHSHTSVLLAGTPNL
jgi:hypothetical protein